MHQLKQDAFEMKAAMLAGDVGLMATILNRSWIAKKATSGSVSNDLIDGLWDIARANGAIGGKVSGAGGGGGQSEAKRKQERGEGLPETEMRQPGVGVTLGDIAPRRHPRV